MFTEHGPRDWERAYASVADGARHLLDDDFTKADLRHLAMSIPARLPWLHPKYPDYNYVPEPWQEEAARYVEKVHRFALELRAVGTYDG